MKRSIWILFFVVILGLSWLSGFSKNSSKHSSSSTRDNVASKSNKSLIEKKKFEKKIIQIRGIHLTVEIADESDEQAKGLMFRKVLSKDQGMLFVYPDSQYLGYWMKNTSIPLDLAYFDKKKRLIEVHSMEPFSTKIVMSSKKAKYVLETNRGWFYAHKIKKGDRFSIFSKKE